MITGHDAGSEGLESRGAARDSAEVGGTSSHARPAPSPRSSGLEPGLEKPDLSQGELRERKDAILSVYNGDGALPRAGQSYISQVVFREKRGQLDAAEHLALTELRELAKEIEALGDVLAKAGREAFLGDLLMASLAKHRIGTGNPIEILVTTCPDYAHDEQTGEFRFEGELGEGPGLVAKTMLAELKPVAELLSTRQFPARVKFLYADHEADNPFLRRQMGLDEDTYRERIDASIAAMIEYGTKEYLGQGIQVAVGADRMTAHMTQRVGANEIDDKTTYGIMQRRQGLYQRLYSRVTGTEMVPNYQEFLRARAAEDIADHRTLGRSVAARRDSGELVSVATLSISALANQFGYDLNNALPVFRYNSEY